MVVDVVVVGVSVWRDGRGLTVVDGVVVVGIGWHVRRRAVAVAGHPELSPARHPRVDLPVAQNERLPAVSEA